MDNGGVITNLKTKEKLGFGNPLLLPKASVLKSGEYIYGTCKPDGSRQCRYYVTYSGGVFRYQKGSGSGSESVKVF